MAVTETPKVSQACWLQSTKRPVATSSTTIASGAESMSVRYRAPLMSSASCARTRSVTSRLSQTSIVTSPRASRTADIEQSA